MRLSDTQFDSPSDGEPKWIRLAAQCERRAVWVLLLTALATSPAGAQQPQTPALPDVFVEENELEETQLEETETEEPEEAALEEREWNPIPPDEDYWDWIRLSSDEWLKGRILRFRDERLEFDSERIKEKTFKWKHIREIHCARPRVWRFRYDVVVIGKGVMRGDRIVVSTAKGEREMPKADLVAILPGAENEASLWRAKASVSAAVRAGNTDQFDLAVNSWARRETANTRLRFDYDNAIGTLNQEDTKNMHRGSARFDYYATRDLFYIPGFFEAFHDPFTNVNIRTTFSAGLGYHLSRGAVDWVAFGTIGYQYQNFVSTQLGVSPDDHNGALLLGTTVEWEITGDLSWYNFYQVQIAYPTVGDTSQRVTTSLQYEITRLLILETAFHWDRIEQPREAMDGTTPVSDDLRLTVGFGIQY
jgi:putative salt-induced outer membrane protein YdiY